MKRKMYLTKLKDICLILIVGLVTFSCKSSLYAEKKKDKSKNSESPDREKLKIQATELKQPTLEAAMKILNLWGEQAQSTQDLFEYSFKYFETNAQASFSDLCNTSEFKALIKKDKRILLGGPMLGSISHDGVSVWVRTAKPAKVSVKVSINNTYKTFGPIHSSAKTDLTAVVNVTGLKPNHSYEYKVMVDENEVAIPAGAAITTTPASDSKETSRVIFGSCFHRWGIGNPKHIQRMLSRQPDAALFLGDIAVQDRKNLLGLHRADYLLRDFAPEWQKLTANTAIYAVWDDHDYFANDKAGIPKGFTLKDKEGVWDVFRRSWNNPSYGLGENGKGIFHKDTVGSFDIIMLDNRYFRENKKGSFLGEEQMAWIKKSLLECKSPFIIMANGSMWSDFVSNGKDSWGVNDPEGREKLFDFIEENKIAGVILISGDRHGARGFTINRKSGFKLYEFEPASLGSRSGPSIKSSKWLTNLFGYDSVYAFGELTADPSKDDPEVTFRLVKENETVLYEKTIKRSEITPK